MLEPVDVHYILRSLAIATGVCVHASRLCRVHMGNTGLIDQSTAVSQQNVCCRNIVHLLNIDTLAYWLTSQVLFLY